MPCALIHSSTGDPKRRTEKSLELLSVYKALGGHNNYIYALIVSDASYLLLPGHSLSPAAILNLVCLAIPEITFNSSDLLAVVSEI